MTFVIDVNRSFTDPLPDPGRAARAQHRTCAGSITGRSITIAPACLPGGVAHPIMFDEADPVLARVRALALGFPDAAEKISHGHPAFFTTKIFAYYGGSVKVDGTYRQHE